jgi:cell division septum initiation protein DivIVA
MSNEATMDNTMDNTGDFEELVEEVEELEEIAEAATSTQLEVAQQPNSVFRRALLGGYKTKDVDQYVERSSEAMDTLIAENKDLKVKIDQLREGSITIRTALASTLRFSENISDTAKRETTTILDHARASAKRFREESATLGASLSSEIEALRKHRDHLTTELSATMESHIRLLDSIDTNSMTDSSRATANELLELDHT